MPMRAYLQGLMASFSIAAGYFPVAMSFGLSATEAGLSAGTCLLISLLVYAGASQFLMISLLGSGAGLLASVPTVLLMNARHVFYGPALAASWGRDRSCIPASALAFGLTDEVFATALAKMGAVPLSQRPSWYFGMACGAYAAWLAGTACGVFLVGDTASWPRWLHEALGFVLPALFFTLLLAGGVRRWKAALATAALAAVLLLQWLPSHHALALAIVLGAAGQALLSGPRPPPEDANPAASEAPRPGMQEGQP